MQPRAQRLKRLVNLYGIVEEMHALELQRMAASVREAERAIEAQQRIAQLARFDGRDALAEGDRMGWTAAETQQETAGWRRLRIEQVRAEREALNKAVREQYMASRLKNEQMRHVTGSIVAQAEIEEGRRLQAALDDRFLARRRWNEARDRLDRLRVNREMKPS
jgi:hypothetical protein